MIGYDLNGVDPHSLGMARQGETVRFLGENGHDLEREDALTQFQVGQILLVAVCSIGGWVSYYRFIDEPGLFNTVMFEPTAASGIETEGQDGATRLGAKHESPTAESGDAQPLEPKD